MIPYVIVAVPCLAMAIGGFAIAIIAGRMQGHVAAMIDTIERIKGLAESLKTES